MHTSGQRTAGITFIGKELGVVTLTEQEVIDVFKAKKSLWSNGKSVFICLPETKSSDASDVCSKIYGKTASEVQKFWLTQVFQGRSRAPHFFESDQSMIDFVAKNPGAIGVFINEEGLKVPAELLIQIVN